MKNFKTQNENGFTRADLAAVVCVIAVLGTLGMAKITGAETAAAGVSCTGNQGQLLRAMHLYTSDNGDFFTLNENNTTPGRSWLAHNATTLPDATNSVKLLDPTYSMLAPYLNGNAGVFKCPADPSTVFAGGAKPRVRSVSMSQAVGTKFDGAGAKTSVDGMWLDGGGHTANRTYRTYARLADVVNPRPANLFVFLDEHPDSINDGGFGCYGPRPTASGYQWIDFPATYHNRAGGFGFADGHAEIHAWLSAFTMTTSPGISQNDLHWLGTHVSARVADQP